LVRVESASHRSTPPQERRRGVGESRRHERIGPWLRLRVVDLNRPFLDDDVPAARRQRYLVERQRLVEPDLNVGEADRVEHAGELRGDTLQPGLRTGPFS